MVTRPLDPQILAFPVPRLRKRALGGPYDRRGVRPNIDSFLSVFGRDRLTIRNT